MSDSRDLAIGAARILDDHRGQQTVVIDISEISSVSDYFVISTATSTGHLRGLIRRVDDYLTDAGVRPLGVHKRHFDSGWLLRDCGFMVVHLMTEETRRFYDLDSLWFQGEIVYQGESPQSPAESGDSRSSDSS